MEMTHHRVNVNHTVFKKTKTIHLYDRIVRVLIKLTHLSMQHKHYNKNIRNYKVQFQERQQTPPILKLRKPPEIELLRRLINFNYSHPYKRMWKLIKIAIHVW
jgi:hypothetical protein